MTLVERLREAAHDAEFELVAPTVALLTEAVAKIERLEREKEEAVKGRDAHYLEIKRAQSIIDDMKAWRASIYDASLNADWLNLFLHENARVDDRQCTLENGPYLAVQIAEQADKAIAAARIAADERADAAERLAEERLEHIVALESALTRLKSPMEGAKTTAEEKAEVRAWCDGLKYSSAYEGRISGLVSRVLDDLDHATAQARSAADVENELSRVVLGWREHDYPAQFDRWTAQYIAGRYHDARNTIRTRRKGESNG